MVLRTLMISESQLLSKKVMHRDQRTTAHRVLDDNVEERTSKSTTEQSNPQNNATSFEFKTIVNTKPMMNNQTKTKSLLNLCKELSFKRRRKEANSILSIIWTMCTMLTPFLLFSYLCTPVHSAPTNQMSQNHQFSDPPKWTNPCGHTFGNVDVDLTTTAPQQSNNVELLERIVTQTKIALNHAKTFFGRYVEKVFNIKDKKDEDILKAWELTKYTFLPKAEQVPKTLGRPLDKAHLKNINIDETLLNMYEFLQMFAVGMEQIVLDEGEFRREFQDTEYRLRTVLCELQSALMERGVSQRPDVSREIMGTHLRHMPSQTDINVRNWVIFRDYVNTLEYANEVFTYLKEKEMTKS